jgi:hypothetical protein
MPTSTTTVSHTARCVPGPAVTTNGSTQAATRVSTNQAFRRDGVCRNCVHAPVPALVPVPSVIARTIPQHANNGSGIPVATWSAQPAGEVRGSRNRGMAEGGLRA